MPKVPQPTLEKKRQVLFEVGLYTRTPSFGRAFAEASTDPEKTSMAESFELVTLDASMIPDVATGKSDIAAALRPIGRWHHQLMVGNLPAYAESLSEEGFGTLGTLVTDSPLAEQIDVNWEKAATGLADEAEVRLLRLPGYSVVAFVATQEESQTQSWIINSNEADPKLREKWLSSQQFGEALEAMTPVQGFVADEDQNPTPRFR